MKIVIIYASAGGGHQKAAEALKDELKSSPGDVSFLIDVLEYSTPWFGHLYKTSYTYLITKIPGFWGMLFALVDLPWLQPLVRILRRVQNGLNTRELQKYLIYNQFDVILTTHFMPNEITSALKKQKKIKSKIITCVTDYDVHRIWLGDAVDYYCVASDWTKEKVKGFGIDTDKIFVTGIPSNKKFSQAHDVPALKKKLELDPDEFTILIATGSFGIGPIEEIIDALDEFQIMVVCGHNKDLFERLSQKKKPLVKVMGLVDNMHELMAVSDVMVTKPGGLSITEALVSRLPLIFFNAIPGQETNNVKVLKEYGIGISGCSIQQIAEQLRELKSSPEKFQEMRKKTLALSKPNAVTDIISLIK